MKSITKAHLMQILPDDPTFAVGIYTNHTANG